MSRAVKMIADRTWLICEEIAPGQSVYMYLLAGDQEALLIDTGFGTIPLREITRELTALPITVLLTHGHFDHIGAAAQFDTPLLHEDDLECYRLHTETTFRKQFGLENEFVHPKYEPQLINSSWTKDLGNRLISIIHTPGHTPEVFVFLMKQTMSSIQQTAHAGQMYF